MAVITGALMTISSSTLSGVLMAIIGLKPTDLREFKAGRLRRGLLLWVAGRTLRVADFFGWRTAPLLLSILAGANEF